MKYFVELILTTIIIFFVWNILKRLFLKQFYKFPQQQNSSSQNEGKDKKDKHKINWDAETVEYEEIKDENRKKN